MMWIIFLAVEKDEKKFEYIFRKKDLDLNLLSMLSLPRCEFPMNTKINPKKKKKEKAT